MARAKPKLTHIKKCARCGEEKPIAQYYPNNYTRCRPCEREYRREAYHNGRHEKVWEAYIKRTHGIDAKQYREMWDAQDGLCKICGRTEADAYPDERRHAIDHDHETGQIRGILCGHCNQAIGHMDDDVDRLYGAAKYLIEAQHAAGK